MSKAIGMIEFKTTATGVTAADAMVKTSDVEIVEAQTVCPGKYIAIITGDLSAVKAAVDTAVTTYEDKCIDSFVLGNPHESLFPAIYGTTQAEFLNICEKLKNAGITPVISGNKDSYALQFGLYQIAANQVYSENPDFNAKLADGTAFFTDPGTWDKVIDQYLLLYKNNYVEAHSLAMSSAEAIRRFCNGEAAMLFSGNFNYSTLSNALGKNLGAFPLPANNQDQPLCTVVSKSGGTAIYSGSQHIELCKKIFEKLYEPTNDTLSSEDEIWKFFHDLEEKGHFTINCNQGWKGDVEWALEDGVSRKIGGAAISVSYITSMMQKAYENG